MKDQEGSVGKEWPRSEALLKKKTQKSYRNAVLSHKQD